MRNGFRGEEGRDKREKGKRGDGKWDKEGERAQKEREGCCGEVMGGRE